MCIVVELEGGGSTIWKNATATQKRHFSLYFLGPFLVPKKRASMIFGSLMEVALRFSLFTELGGS